MKLVVGLGNPGPRYETTRHNIGFLAVDRLADAWQAPEPAEAFDGFVAKAEYKGEKVLLAKPQTFMNRSGLCVGPLLRFYKLGLEDLIVLQDEIDLPPFELRIKTGGGSAGHNGLKSIDQHAGGAGYHRVRLGIGRPPGSKPGQQVADFVLEPFADAELRELDVFLDRAAQAVEHILEKGALSAMNTFHTTGEAKAATRGRLAKPTQEEA